MLTSFDPLQNWDGSDAQKLLELDVAGYAHVGMTPKELQKTRDEYKQIELTVFRNHLYQEIRKTKETNYWLVKKRKKELKRRGIDIDGCHTNDEWWQNPEETVSDDHAFSELVLQFERL